MSFIYIKQSPSHIIKISYLELDTTINQYPNGFIGAEMPSDGHAHHYFYWLKGQQLQRFPIRKTDENYSCMQVFAFFDLEKKTFSPTIHQTQEAPDLKNMDINSFFSSEEIQTLRITQPQTRPNTQSNVVETPYFDGSPLTQDQQQFLYHGMASKAGVFHHAIKSILENFPDRAQILLTACISQKAEDQQKLNAEEQIEVNSFRFHFLALDEINKIFDTIYTHIQGARPSIGAIYDYYVYCIQNVLTQQVKPDDLISYSDKSRNTKIGEETDFGKEGMSNPQGLRGDNDILFRCLSMIFSLQHQNRTPQHIETILRQREFWPIRYKLHSVLLDLWGAVNFNAPTQLTEYLEVYTNINVLFPREGLRFLSKHIHISYFVNMSFFTAQELIQTSGLPDESQSELLNVLGTTPRRDMVAHALILLHSVNLLTKENIAYIKAFSKIETILLDLSLLKYAGSLNHATLNSIKTSNHPIEIINAFVSLAKHHLLNDENRLKIAQSPSSYDFCSTIAVLQEAKLLTQGNFIAIDKKAPKLFRIINLLKLLQQNKILTQVTLDLALTRESPEKNFAELSILKNANLLNTPNAIKILHYNSPPWMRDILTQLSHARMLTQANLDSIQHSIKPQAAIPELIRLTQHGLLTDAIRTAIEKHEYPNLATNLLLILKTTELFNPPNCELIVLASSYHPTRFSLLTLLKKTGIFTQQNFELVMHHPAPYSFEKTLTELSQNGQLNQNTFDAMAALDNASLLTPRYINTVITSKDPSATATALTTLEKTNLLTEENIKTIETHEHVLALSSALTTLRSIRQLNQDTFNKINATPNPDENVNLLLSQLGLFRPKPTPRAKRSASPSP